MSWEAYLLEHSPRAADWQRVFGGLAVPVTSPLTRPANLPGFVGAVEVYLVDVEALDVETRARLVAHLADRFGLSREEVEHDLDAAGCPILEKDVSVPIPMRDLLPDDDDEDLEPDEDDDLDDDDDEEDE